MPTKHLKQSRPIVKYVLVPRFFGMSFNAFLAVLNGLLQNANLSKDLKLSILNCAKGLQNIEDIYFYNIDHKWGPNPSIRLDPAKHTFKTYWIDWIRKEYGNFKRSCLQLQQITFLQLLVENPILIWTVANYSYATCQLKSKQ